MHTKTHNVHARPKFKFHGIDSNKRLTRLFRASLSRSWLHPYIRARRFFREYSLPVVITLLFLLIIAGAWLLRISQRSSLADLLSGVTIAGQDYGTLLSNDKTDELKRNTDTAEPTNGTPAQNRTGFVANPTPSGTPAAGGSPATGGNGSPSGGGTTTPAPVFTATIASFQQNAVTLECSTPKPKLQTCSKRYSFSGSISTANGPGTVDYGWRSNLQAGTEDGIIAAGGGDSTTAVQKSFTLACTAPITFTMQLTIFSPALRQSSTLNINHNCNDI